MGRKQNNTSKYISNKCKGKHINNSKNATTTKLACQKESMRGNDTSSMRCRVLKLFSILTISLHTLAFLASPLLLSGCDAPLTETMAPESDHVQVTIATGQEINGRMALRIDFVQVYDKKLFESLKEMDATLFREKKRQILLDHADDMALWSYDFTEAQTATLSFPTSRNYWGIVIYLHFIDNPQNRIILTKPAHIRLQIADGSFKIVHDSKSGKYISLEEGGNA